MLDIDYIIIELAEYIKGNRGDADGYLASFFRRDPSNGYLCLDALITHSFLQNWRDREFRIHYGDPYKKRTLNLYSEGLI